MASSNNIIEARINHVRSKGEHNFISANILQKVTQCYLESRIEDTNRNICFGACVNSFHMKLERWSVSVSIPIVLRYKEVCVDHFVLKSNMALKGRFYRTNNVSTRSLLGRYLSRGSLKRMEHNPPRPS